MKNLSKNIFYIVLSWLLRKGKKPKPVLRPINYQRFDDEQYIPF